MDNVKKTPGIVERNVGRGVSVLGRGITAIGIILTSPLPNPGCDCGSYNSGTGMCEGSPLKPEIDTSANPNPADNSPTGADKNKENEGPPDNEESRKPHRTKGDWDKHSKPKAGRRTTKDRQKWDRVWRPRKKT